MSVTFVTTAETIREVDDIGTYMLKYTYLDRNMSYDGFNNLRDQIEAIVEDHDLYNRGLQNYFQVPDTDGQLVYLDCLDILATINEPAFNKLHTDPNYQTFQDVLTTAVKTHKNLVWS